MPSRPKPKRKRTLTTRAGRPRTTPTGSIKAAFPACHAKACRNGHDRPALTDEMITEAMARAEKVACTPGDQRCLPLPYDVESARQTCTPKGRCKIGWIVADAGRKAWDVWLDLHTGEGRLRRWVD